MEAKGRGSEREEMERIEAEREESAAAQKQIENEETEQGYQADQDLKKIGMQMEHLRNDPQLFPLLSEQEQALKGIQRDRVAFLSDVQKESAGKRRKLEDREAECKARLNKADS